jgi:hypothetical protein
MSGTNYDKICFITLKQAIDLRYPVVISTCDYPVGNAWDIVEHAAGNSPNPIGVALSHALFNFSSVPRAAGMKLISSISSL